MTQDVTRYGPNRVDPAGNLKTLSTAAPPADQRDRNLILTGLVALAVLAVIAIILIALIRRHPHPAPPAPAAAPASTGFYIGTHGDSPEAHGMSHKEALKMSALNDMPFVALRPGAAWKWLTPAQARRFLIWPRKMTLPVCAGDFIDPSLMKWLSAPGTPSLARRRWLVEHDHRDFCVLR